MDYPFTTDGCSGGMSAGWQFISHKPPPWNNACIEHDYAYWRGGTKRDRAIADGLLSVRVMNQGYWFISFLMWCCSHWRSSFIAATLALGLWLEVAERL